MMDERVLVEEELAELENKKKNKKLINHKLSF
jgi:hypothetical protein